MKKSIIFFLIVILGFTLSVFAQEFEQLIAEGDSISKTMASMAEAKEAKAKYEQALQLEGDKYEVYWGLSRILYYIGDHTADKKMKQEIFQQGIDYAKKAIELEPGRPDGYYWLGVNYGLFGEAKGILKSLSLVGPIKEAMQKIIEIDRSYEDGGADRVLGRMFYRLPGFAGGNKQKSLLHLRKSKEFGPSDPVTRVYLAETLMALRRYDEAKEELEFVINMEDDPSWMSGVSEQKKRASELLRKKVFQKR
ncbi:MAG: TRAP transporter TatT component family protein [Candidatus Aminicenantales bacterium]